MLYMENNFTRLQNTVIDYSSCKQWEYAIDEWEIVDFAEDTDMQASCVCGKERIKYLYTIENRKTGTVLEPIGSKCITKFGREDMKDQVNIYERLFKLVNARRDGKFIDLKGKEKYFSNKLLDYLLDQEAINIGRHHTLKQLFNKRNELTYKQAKFATWIILNEIFPYLDREIEKKVKSNSNVIEFKPKNNEDNGISKIIEMRKNGKFISRELFDMNMIDELNNQSIFSTGRYDNYKILTDLMKKDELNAKQSKLAQQIIYFDVLPFLDKQIADTKTIEIDEDDLPF